MKEFKIPPVIFPSGGSRTTTLHQRASTVPFQPSGFNSFDVADQLSHPSTFPYGGPTITTPDTLFSHEPSLLEELEIDPTLIYHKTLSLLNPIKFDPSTHSPPDLSGPFLYYISFCTIQLLSGKVQFGVVLGWIVVYSTLLYFLLNMLDGKYCNLDLYKSFSIVGYSFLPILVFSAVSLFVPPGAAAARLCLAAVFVLWSTWVSARVLANGNELSGLIAYPCFLIYTLFAMLVLF